MKMPQSEAEWKKKLDQKKYHVLREKGTEMPFTGELLKNKEKGDYMCGACGAKLFSSDTKFDSGTGWPSFTEANLKNVELKDDSTLGMHRIEVLCKKCGSHLGHVFDDGPKSLNGKKASGQRYCINSCSLEFKKKED